MTIPSWLPRRFKVLVVRLFVRYSKARGMDVEVRDHEGRVYGRTKGKT